MSEAPRGTFTPVDLPCGYGWLMRPVDRGYIGYRELREENHLGLGDIALMNDMADVADENHYRANKPRK